MSQVYGQDARLAGYRQSFDLYTIGSTVLISPAIHDELALVSHILHILILVNSCLACPSGPTKNVITYGYQDSNYSIAREIVFLLPSHRACA
jgi:hypothetical protein